MNTLSANTNGMIKVNGYPYQKGDLLAFPAGPDDYSRLTVQTKGGAILFSAPLAEVGDSDGTAFASETALQTFVEDNFFFKVAGGGPGGSVDFQDVGGDPADNTALVAYVAANSGGLPSMVGNAGKMLTNDGSAGFWTGVNYLIVQGLATGQAAAAANTALINAAIIAAAAIGYSVMIPAGTWHATTIVWDGNTPIFGSGRDRTILRSVNTVPLVQWAGNTAIIQGGGISHLTLDGDGHGTIGLDIGLMAWFEINEVRARRFTVTAFDLKGCLTFTIRNCLIQSSPYGIKITSGPLSGGGEVGANLIKIHDCIIGGGNAGCSLWGIWCGHEGASIQIIGCDIEHHGTPGNAATGGVYTENLNGEGAGVGLIIQNSWLEANTGTVLYIAQSLQPAKHIITNSFWGNSADYSCLVRVEGDMNEVMIENSQIRYGLVTNTYAPYPEMIVATGARVKGKFVKLATVKEYTGGTYREYPEDYGTINTPTGNGGTSYDAQIIASSPAYYNRANGSSSPIAPTVGTGNITATGGVTLADTYTPFPFDTVARSIAINDNTRAVSVPLKIGGATTFAFSFWAYMNPGNADAFITTNWNSAGSLVVARNQTNGQSYVAVSGNAGTKDGLVSIGMEAGWTNYVFKGTAGGFSSIMENGRVIYTGTSNGSNNALTDLTLTWSMGGRFCCFATWIDAAIPTTADFVRFYQARFNP